MDAESQIGEGPPDVPRWRATWYDTHGNVHWRRSMDFQTRDAAVNFLRGVLYPGEIKDLDQRESGYRPL